VDKYVHNVDSDILNAMNDPSPKDSATKYLLAVVDGICPRGVELLCEESDVGLAYTLIPKVAKDYRILIGFKGKHSSLLRYLMKLWRNEHAPNLSIHVFVPNPKLIKHE